MTTPASKKQPFETLFQMMAAFPDEQAAIDHFTAIRWRDGAYCPLCGSTKVYHFSDQRTHKCGDCRKRFSIKVGTIFEDSKIELRKWMMAIWLITSHKKGIASTALAKDIGVTQKTAWLMLHRLRYAALNLAGRQHRMYHAAHFLYRCEIIDASLVGRRIHRHFRHVNGPRICAIGIAAIRIVVPENARRRFVFAERSQNAKLLAILRARGVKLVSRVTLN